MYSATSAREILRPPGYSLPGAVPSAGRPVRESTRRPHDGPVQSALPDAGLHASQVDEDVTEERTPDDAVVDPGQAGIAAGADAAAGEDDEPPHAVALHGTDHVERAEGIDGGCLAARRAQDDEDGVSTVDRIADDATVQHVAHHGVDPIGEIAEPLRGAHQCGHGVAAPDRAPRQQSARAAGRSHDEDVHGGIVPERRAASV